MAEPRILFSILLMSVPCCINAQKLEILFDGPGTTDYKNVKLNETLVLKCYTISAVFKSGQQLKWITPRLQEAYKGRITQEARNNDKYRVLTVRNFEKADAGIYTCTNDVLKLKPQSVKVVVDYGPKKTVSAGFNLALYIPLIVIGIIVIAGIFIIIASPKARTTVWSCVTNCCRCCVTDPQTLAEEGKSNERAQEKISTYVEGMEKNSTDSQQLKKISQQALKPEEYQSQTSNSEHQPQGLKKNSTDSQELKKVSQQALSPEEDQSQTSNSEGPPQGLKKNATGRKPLPKKKNLAGQQTTEHDVRNKPKSQPLKKSQQNQLSKCPQTVQQCQNLMNTVAGPTPQTLNNGTRKQSQTPKKKNATGQQSRLQESSTAEQQNPLLDLTLAGIAQISKHLEGEKVGEILKRIGNGFGVHAVQDDETEMTEENDEEQLEDENEDIEEQEEENENEEYDNEGFAEDEENNEDQEDENVENCDHEEEDENEENCEVEQEDDVENCDEDEIDDEESDEDSETEEEE